MAKRISKRIVDQSLKDVLLNLKEKDITSSFIYDLFGEFNGVAKCNPYDTIEIPDDDLIYDYSCAKVETNKKNEFQNKIVIEPYIKDEKKFSLPIATFTTI